MQPELVERARRGERQAFETLVAGNVDRCYALAYRILRDPEQARDATQQAFLGAWRDLAKLRDAERFDAWLYRLVVHAAYGEARSARRWSARVRAVAVGRGDVRDHAPEIAARDELDAAFRTLSPEHRAVVVLHHYVGYPLTEIAAVLGIPVGTARSRLHHAVRRLRAVLDVSEVDIAREERPA